MPEQIIKDIQIKYQKNNKTTPAKMFILQFTDKEQKIRALKALFKFWLIATVCVLIPVAHFILVPLFFIMGIYKASQLWHKGEDGLKVDGTCPACDNTISVPLDNDPSLPQWFDCPECSEHLELNS